MWVPHRQGECDRPRFQRSLSITAKGQNVFDDDYEEVFGFSTAGAKFLIGFRAEL
ncbi:MAG: hypothetical protein ACREXX_21075 [Gammaproteobacteria bacterium]